MASRSGARNNSFVKKEQISHEKLHRPSFGSQVDSADPACWIRRRIPLETARSDRRSEFRLRRAVASLSA
jgi:hypothetical protein